MGGGSVLKESEDLLRDSEQHPHRLADAQPQIVWVTGPEGFVTYCNSYFYDYTGLTEEEARGAGWQKIIHPEDLPTCMKARLAALATGNPWRCEYRLRRHDGEWRWHQAHAAPVRDSADGPILHWVGTALDITEYRQAGEALREGQRQLRELADLMPQIVWTANASGNSDWFNRRWYEYTGLSTEDSLNGSSMQRVHPEDVGRCHAEWRRALAGAGSWECEYRLRHRDGGYRWFLGRLVPVRGEGGRIERWIGTATDIHERKEEERRERFLADLVERTRVLRDPDRVAQETARAVMEFLELSWCYLADVDMAADRISVPRHRLTPTVAARGGRPASIWGAVTEELRVGRTVVVRDTATDVRSQQEYSGVYAPVGIRAFVAVPLLRENCWVAVLAVNVRMPREWTEEEVALLEAVAERTWLTVENARLFREAEQERERFRALIEASSQMVWRADSSGAVEGMAEWRAYTGQEEQALADWGWLDAVHEADRERLRRSWRIAVGNRRAFSQEFRLRGHDGIFRWFVARGVPLLDEEGGLREYIGSAANIDVQRRAEQERAAFAAQQQRIAETLQRSLLITPTPDMIPGGLEVYPFYEAASEEALVGGDFFDVFPLAGNRAALVVGDITGKGLNAAALTAEVKFALRTLLREHEGDPAEALVRLNRHLVQGQELDGRQTDVFACVIAAVMDPGAGQATLAVAGMESPLVLRAATADALSVESVPLHGTILGALPEWKQEALVVPMAPGDTLMLFTDGLTEARRPADRSSVAGVNRPNFFGAEGVAQAALSACTQNKNLEDAAETIIEAARVHAGGRVQDDVCMLLARLNAR